MKSIQAALRFTAIGILFFAGACSILRPGPSSPASSAAPATRTFPTPGEPGEEGLPTGVGTGEAAGPASCPSPNADQSLYDGSGPGFCFVYPADFYLYPSAAVILIGPQHGSGAGSQAGTVTITSEALAGQTLQDYADQVMAQNGQGASLSQQPVNLGNRYPAIMIDGLRSQLNRRDVLAEHNGRVYQISFQPWDDTAPEARADLQRMYASLVDSWVFLK